MKKYNIHTTLSSKHWEILKKHVEKHETQQKVFELALENFDSYPKPAAALSPEEQYWLSLAGNEYACLIQKDGLKLLLNTLDLTALQEHVTRDKPIEFSLEHYYQKPLKEFSLKEIVEGLVITSRITHWHDTIGYTDDGDYYTLKVTHSMGPNLSKMLDIFYKSVFKTCGARAESTLSEKTFFMKIYKN